jgi:simple sugar transport system substrate-binding protein
VECKKILILKNLVSIEDNTDHRNQYHKDPKRKRKMKKYNLALLVSLTIVSIVLTACGASVANQAPVATPVSAVATGEPTSAGLACAPNCQYSDLVVGFLQTGSEGGWRAANTASFKQTADELGLKLKFYDSQNDLARQVAGFQRFIQDPEVNVIILAALETTGWEEVLIQAQDAGKIVVIEDRRIDAPEDLYATYIGSDFAEEGRKTATEMCKLLEGTAGKNVWELVGNIGSSAAKDRGEGFRDLMSACGIEITKSQTANWSATEGKQVTEAWLKEGTDVQGIFAQNDEMAFGAIEAIKAAGLVPGVDVKIISVDATAGAFQAMLDGTLNVTVECNPLLAPQVYEAALKAANSESQPKWVPSQESVFFADDPNLQTIISGRTY